MLNSHKFSEKNCKILKTKLVRSIFIYLEFQKKKKSSVTALRKEFFFFRQKLVSLTRNWGDFYLQSSFHISILCIKEIS